MKSILVFMTALMAAASAGATAFYVDNVNGSDSAGTGAEDKPFRTAAQALQKVRISDAVFLTPNPEPYRESLDLPVGGTVEKPFLFDGRGAVINRLTHYGVEAWTNEGGGVFSMPLPNNAHVMDKQWWGFDLVFFDGRAGTNCASRETLQPLGYFLFKQRLQIEGKFHPLHNRLTIRLPDGKTPADIKVEAPGVGTGFHCGKPCVTIRNLTSMYSTGDGFSSTRAPGIVFERVRGCYNMDQGISHHGSQVVVRDSRFDHNAGCGIVDVYPEAKTRYERCLVEDDTYRGGVEFLKGEYSMQDCVIRNNPGKAFAVNKGARAAFRNCLFIGPASGDVSGGVVYDGDLTLDRCTFYRFGTGLTIGQPCVRLAMTDCAFVQCGEAYKVMATNAVDVTQAVVLKDYKGPVPPWSIPSLKGKGRDGADIGARLEPASFTGRK
jgi:hypothetical protein